MTSIECRTCVSRVPAGTKFCPHCGSQLDQPCGSCGALVVAGTRFCGQCGAERTDPAVAADLRKSESITAKLPVPSAPELSRLSSANPVATSVNPEPIRGGVGVVALMVVVSVVLAAVAGWQFLHRMPGPSSATVSADAQTRDVAIVAQDAEPSADIRRITCWNGRKVDTMTKCPQPGTSAKALRWVFGLDSSVTCPASTKRQRLDGYLRYNLRCTGKVAGRSIGLSLSMYPDGNAHYHYAKVDASKVQSGPNEAYRWGELFTSWNFYQPGDFDQAFRRGVVRGSTWGVSLYADSAAMRATAYKQLIHWRPSSQWRGVDEG